LISSSLELLRAPWPAFAIACVKAWSDRGLVMVIAECRRVSVVARVVSCDRTASNMSQR
jgi:hypothetical protein